MQIKKFINEVLNEMKFVEWPTKKVVMASTMAVLVISFFAAVYLGGADYELQRLLAKFVN